MQFSVGYKFFDENGDSLTDYLVENKRHISEVYFPWIDNRTCRASLVDDHGDVDWGGQERLEGDLVKLRNAGIRLNLLMNANCYGSQSISRYLYNNVCSIIERIYRIAGLPDSVTTASPFIAKVVKRSFPEIYVKASVNMRIGDERGMEYLADYFDGYYLLRDLNRRPIRIKQLKDWCRLHGKGLHTLVNSGCMISCSGQTFHDNLVAHEKEIMETKNLDDYEPCLCWHYYSNESNMSSILGNTWIRPEDLHNYNELFSEVKLATRQTKFPKKVINAYIREKYYGNLLDLFEPNHSPLLKNRYISNSLFPEDWYEKTKDCTGQCSECGYCKNVFQRVVKEIPNIVFDKEEADCISEKTNE